MLLLIGSEKGGTGKTTLAVNLAAMRAMAGHEVLLVDTDRQESASTWALTRNESESAMPLVTCVTKTGKVGYDLAQLKPKFDTIIVDAGGRDSTELRQAMAVCDRMVIPVRPSQFDTWSLDKMGQLIKDIEDKVGVKIDARALLNACSTNPSVTEVKETRELLAEYVESFPTMTCSVGDRIAFRRAARAGACVCELSTEHRDAKAVQEMAAVYQEIFNDKWTVTQASAGR